MKIFFLVLITFSISSCSFFKSENDGLNFENHKMQFVEGSQDIPLAQGLSKFSDDDGLGFDSVGGSVSSSSYKSTNNIKEVKDFYLKTLPQLGWKIAKRNKGSSLDNLNFVRDKEKLEIEFVFENNINLVKFFVESSAN